MELTVKLPKSHRGQQKLLKNRKRNNLCILPRRYGKTTFVQYLLGKIALSEPKKRCSYSAPTWKLMIQMWEDLINILRPVIKRSSREDRRIVLVNDSFIDLWSSDDPQSGRGRKYHIWLHDEAQRDRNLNKFIFGSVRPTLADYQGELWILGTANGIGSDLHALYLESEKNDDWYVAQGKISDNPFIKAEEIQQMYQDMGPTLAAQELESEWVKVDGIAPLIRKSLWEELSFSIPPENSKYIKRVLSWDGSISGDYSVLVSAYRVGEEFYTDYDDIYVFKPEDGIEGEIDYDHAERTILGLWQTGRFEAICYDEYQAVSMMQRLKRRGVKCIPFSQSSKRLKADSYFRQLLNEGKYHHPNHEDLTAHVLSATIKYSQNGYIRLVKGTQKEKIDLAVALSMCLYTIKEINPIGTAEYKPVTAGQRQQPIQQIKSNPFGYLKTISPFRK